MGLNQIQWWLKIAALAIIGFSLSAQALTMGTGDWLPWPWGTECPFPWSSINGDWVTQEVSGRSAGQERFSFVATGSRRGSTRVLEVRHFDTDGKLIGLGKGVARRGDRIVRAVMAGVGKAEGINYWAIIRTYSQNRLSCSKSHLVTVVTLRPLGGSTNEDFHMIVEKDSGRDSKVPGSVFASQRIGD